MDHKTNVSIHLSNYVLYELEHSEKLMRLPETWEALGYPGYPILTLLKTKKKKRIEQFLKNELLSFIFLSHLQATPHLNQNVKNKVVKEYLYRLAIHVKFPKRKMLGFNSERELLDYHYKLAKEYITSNSDYALVFSNRFKKMFNSQQGVYTQVFELRNLLDIHMVANKLYENTVLIDDLR